MTEIPGIVPPSINCHSCGAVIDLAGQTGFAHVECPQCTVLSVVPVQFGNFLLLNTLGIGGMGTVYKAIDLSLNRYIALKILRSKLASNPVFIENFATEARAAAAINHPNVAQVYSFGETAGQYYLAMELLERGSLDDRMSHLGKIPEKDMLTIALQVSQGLRAAHQRGLLHRDIKPGNILFNDDGVPKLVDFGLARPPASEEGAETAANEPIWGTPYYIAPEKLIGEREDERSDIYSLGATFFHALAGRPPFDARTADEVVAKHASTPAYSLKTYVPNIHPVTADVIGRMLAKNPAERYTNCDGLISDLQAAEDRFKEEAAHRTVVTATGERVSMTALIATGAAIVACLALVAVLWLNRAAIFGNGAAPKEVPPPPSHTIPSATNGTPQLPPVVHIVGNKVDFNSDEPSVKTWQAATLQLAQGYYQDALFNYENAIRTLPATQQIQRRWYQFYEALTLFAWGRPTDARQYLIQRTDGLELPSTVPAEVGLTNFVDVLISVALEKIPLADLQKAAPQFPSWAKALATLTTGFKEMERGNFTRATDAFGQYENMKSEGPHGWAFNLQTLTPKLRRECRQSEQTLADIANYEQSGQLRTGLRIARAELKKTTFIVVRKELEKRISRMEAALAKEEEREKAAQQKASEEEKKRAEEARQQAEFQKQDFTLLKGVFNVFLASYDFKNATAKAAEINKAMRSDAGKAAAAHVTGPIQYLVDFKAQLSKDIAQRAYKQGDLQTRGNAALPGSLNSATDTQLIFTTPYGALATDWRDMAPSMLLKLADHYAAAFAGVETPKDQARRYLLMAVFCKQYDLEKQAQGYAARALQLNPDLQSQVNKLLASPPPGPTGP